MEVNLPKRIVPMTLDNSRIVPMTLDNDLYLKLDAFGRQQIEKGFPEEGIDLIIQLSNNSENNVNHILNPVFSVVGNIVTGHVDSESSLKDLVKLSCVESVQFSTQLHIEN